MSVGGRVGTGNGMRAKPGLGRNEFIGFGYLFYLLRVVTGYFSG